MAEDSTGTEVDSFVNTLFTRLQTVNTERKCIEKTRQTRTVSFRVPVIAKMLYDTVLTEDEKETMKYLVEGMIYALAGQRLGGELPCESIISKRLAATASMVTGQGRVIFNVNIAEARPSVNINISIINEIREIAEKLYELRTPLPPIQRQLVERLHRIVQRMN